MKYKKSLMLLITLLCVMLQSVMIVAQEPQTTGHIYATDIVTAPGSTFDVSVCIESNPGVMGLGLYIYYDEKLLTPISIKKGTVLQQGMLTDSIGASDYEGKIKVLWSHTENVVENGELFIIQFSVNGQEENLSELEITCEKADTFNSDWDEVDFTTSNATVRVKADVEISDEQLPSTDDKSEEEKTSERIDQAVTIRDEMKNQLPENEVKDVIEDALKEFNAEHPKDVKKEEHSKFVQRVSSLFQQKGVDVQALWENNSNEQKMEILTYLWEEVSGIQSIEKTKEQHENTQTLKGTAIVAIPVIFLIVLGLCFVYRRKRREKKDGNKE